MKMEQSDPPALVRLSEGLGPVARTVRGFELLEFKDRYGTPCSLQASSLAEYEKPGTSAVWLGTDDVAPKVLGLTTRMHLDREQVAALIQHLQSWLDNDSFAGPNSPLTGAPKGASS